MEKKNLLTKVLTITGTLLVWFPILAPILFFVPGTLRRGIFHFDYLMPAELFPSVLLGGVLLLWAAFRTHARRGLIGWGLGLAVGFPVIGSVIATITGLASGATEPTGWQWVLVLTMLVAYVLAVIATGVGGALLWHDLFKPPARASL